MVALARMGMADLARQELDRLIALNDDDGWRFTEWFHGRSLVPSGMPGQSWNAAALLLALDAVEKLDARTAGARSAAAHPHCATL